MAVDLPAETSTFVGRDTELSDVGRLITRARLVTLTGPGGVGKTRLALRAAAAFAAESGGLGGSGGEVAFAELAAERNGDLLGHAVAAALGLREQSVRPQAEVLAEHLAGRPVLIVLDTCEHLIDAVRELAGLLLAAAPQVRLLATSRQQLGLEAERVYRVHPLGDADAQRLFCERARAVLPQFTPTDAVVRLCARLEGIPLALELAARRLRALSPEELADRLDDRFALLGGGGRTGRHDGLRSAVGWSHELCTPEERLLWARLSVFAGSFDVDAAGQVCADHRLGNVPGILARLADKSIVQADDDRYRMLDTIREYGREWLRELGEEEQQLRRHRDYYLTLAKEADADWFGPNQFTWALWVRCEMPNLRLALDHSIASSVGLELAGALWFVWFCLGEVREGRYYLDRALERNSRPGPARTKALWAAAWVSFAQGDLEPVAHRTAEASEAAVAQQDWAGAGYAYLGLGALAAVQGDPERGGELIERAIGYFDQDGGRHMGRLVAASVLALTLVMRGRPAGALTVLAEQRAECEHAGEVWARSNGETVRSGAELGLGDPLSADQHGRTGLRALWRLGDVMGSAMAVDQLAMTASAIGDHPRAARLLGAGHRIWTTFGLTQFGSAKLAVSRRQAELRARAAIGDAAFEQAYADGAEFTPERAVGYALGGLPNSPHMRWNLPAD
ncbi:ATP-binding protein [Acrocarpospora catenulata]|uniref:ATP-binding protein n=1 Tax=Acrocarpospora catenulata TaxID=2836182 RepID=UPI001BDAD9D9|nr:LuxR family transcriptional regulator [Acrocarpospora catenulata]